MMPIHLTAAVLICVLLSGCAGTAASPSLFMLSGSNQPVSPGPERADAPTLIVSAVTVAPYLDQGGIVYQTAPYRVVVANNNRWASPLSIELTNSLYATLARRLDGVDVVRDAAPDKPGALRLKTHVSDFIGHYDGNAHVAGQWAVVNKAGHTLTSNTFDQHVPLPRDGYPALVASLSSGWRKTSRAIADIVGQTMMSTATAPDR